MYNMKIDMKLHEKCSPKNIHKQYLYTYTELCSTAHILQLYNEEKFDNSTNNSHQKNIIIRSKRVNKIQKNNMKKKKKKKEEEKGEKKVPSIFHIPRNIN